MKASHFKMPAGQNWSCQGCADCCRGDLIIPLTPEDRARLAKQNWTAADGVDPSRLVISGINQDRLGHQADGTCVFLDKANRCRIHSKFGESEKPLTCRLYPLVIHPAGKNLVVGLRYSCPAALANQGRPLTEQAAEVARISKLFLPEDYAEIPAPAVAAAAGLAWEDFLRFIRWLDRTLAEANAPVALKLLRALHWLEGIERGSLDQIQGESADEILEALVENARGKISSLEGDSEKPSRFGRLFLRLSVLEYARPMPTGHQEHRFAGRWQLLKSTLGLMRSSGRTQALRKELKAVKIRDIEQLRSVLSPAAEALLTRYFRVKVQSLHFCGNAFFHRPLIEGFRNLAMVYPAVIWLSRWLALSKGSSEVSDTDVFRAVSLVDYQYSYTPYLPWRTRLLQQRQDIGRLCRWYGR